MSHHYMTLWKVHLQPSCKPPLGTGKDSMVSLQASLLQSGKFQLSQPVFTGEELQLCDHLVTSLCTCSNRFTSLLCWGPQAAHSVPGGVSKEQSWGAETPPWPTGCSSFDVAEDVVGFLSCQCASLIILNFSYTDIPKSFSTGLLLIHSLSSLHAGSFPWPFWASWCLHRPTSSACQSPSGRHPFPPTCQPHRASWCCWDLLSDLSLQWARAFIAPALRNLV